MKDNPAYKKLLAIILIPVVGYILLTLTFLLDFLFQSFISRILPMNENSVLHWIPAGRHGIFAILILILSWLILKTKLKDTYKAIYVVVPTAVVFVTIGISLYQRPYAVYSISGIIYGCILLYLYKTKRPWVYYYAVTLVAATLIAMGIMGIDI